MNATLTGITRRGNIALNRPCRGLLALAFGLLLAATLMPAAQTLPASAQADTPCTWPAGWSQLNAPEYPGQPGGFAEARASLRTVAAGWEGAQTVYAGGARGLYRSDDCAATWRRIWEPNRTPVGRDLHPVLMLAVGRDSRIYFGGVHVHLVMTSEDGGISWREADASPKGPTSLGVAPSDSRIIYIFGKYYDRNPPPGLPIWQSIDSGLHWTQRTKDGPQGSLVVDPADPATIYSIGQGVVLRSLDAAQTFEGYSVYDLSVMPTAVEHTNAGAGIGAVSTDGSRFWFISRTGRMHISADRGRTWPHASDVPFVSPARAVAASVFDPHALYAVSDDGYLWVYREPAAAPVQLP